MNFKGKKIMVQNKEMENQEESDKEDLTETEEEDDDFRLFVKRFNKFLRNKRNKRESSINTKKKIPPQPQNAMKAINLAH